MKRRPIRRFLHRYWVTIVLVFAFASGVFGFLAWHAISVDAYVQSTSTQVKQMTAEAETIAQEVEAKRIAKLEAEKKARQQVAAKEAAEKARSGKSDSIDPKACNVSTKHNNPASIDVLVNKKHCIQPLRYAPSDLVTARGATISAKASSDFNALYAAAAAAGQPIYVTSSYRSYATQISTYNRWVSISGRDGADTYSARPGYSEHQTGFAIDVAANGCTLNCFGKTAQYKWFQANAAKYGFIQRYYAGYEAVTGYSAEEWHYRYVGKEVALDMQEKGIKTLEEYWSLEGGDYY